MVHTAYLNSPYTKAMANEVFGEIHHPVIAEIPRMIMSFREDNSYRFEDLRIWKFDLRKAFTLLTYETEAVEKIGIELSDNTFMFFLAGVFGLTGMPMAFQVITRAIVYEVNKRIHGRLKMYVDDGIVVSHSRHMASDQLITFSFISDLLGDNAIEHTKTVEGRVLDFIGYEVHLDRLYVSVGQKNLKKALYAYQDVDLTPGARVTVKKLQGLASLGSRYGYISHLMRPFVRTIYSCFRGQSHSASVVLDTATIRVIRLFKSLFVLLALRGESFARPFASFSKRRHTWVCEYDASLSGIGIIWFEVQDEGAEIARAYASIDISELGFGDNSAYQNTAEYIGGLLASFGMIRLGVGDQPALHRGDSVSSLTWTQKGTVRSDIAIKPALLWGVLVMTSQCDVVNVHPLTHDENSNADILSRHGTWSDVLDNNSRKARPDNLPRDTPRLDLRCSGLLRLCDPLSPIDTDNSFGSFFRAAIELGDSFRG
jgi:hypothetical protein